VIRVSAGKLSAHDETWLSLRINEGNDG